MFNIVPKVYAACDTTQNGLKLTDCLILNDKGETVAQVYKNPAVLINLFVRNAFIFGGIIFFFLIIYSGIQFISGGKKGAEQAQKVMTTALTGFIVMFAAYWILQIIKIVTGADFLNFE
jgi:hypothetical protein